jgi:archaellum biogenesis protein FlaJ (TadC family)
MDRSILDWIKSNGVLLTWLSAASLVMFFLTPVVVGWIVIRLPRDYFAREQPHPTRSWQRHHLLRPVVFVIKNLVGIVLLLAGLVMLAAPGQGLLTIVVGLTLLSFPGKARLERWIAIRPAVWRAINWLRQRAGRDALEHPK